MAAIDMLDGYPVRTCWVLTMAGLAGTLIGALIALAADWLDRKHR